MNKRGAAGLLRSVAFLPRKIVSLPIVLYRRYISPLKRTSTCRFTPTCSEYALEALAEWGVIIGLALAIRRILRCNPFGPFGADPVPKRRRSRDTDVTEDKQ